MASTVERLGDIHVLFSNAGIGDRAPAEEMTLEQWHRVLDINLSGAWYFDQAVGRHMIERGIKGSIINTSSITSLVGITTGNANYAATKGALNALTRTLAIEWAPHGIRVNAIAPTHVKTALIEQKMEDDPALAEFFLGNIPLGPHGHARGRRRRGHLPGLGSGCAGQRPRARGRRGPHRPMNAAANGPCRPHHGSRPVRDRREAASRGARPGWCWPHRPTSACAAPISTSSTAACPTCTRASRSYPLQPGHEWSGTLLEATGELAAGTRVILDPIIDCGRDDCELCGAGLVVRCVERREIGVRNGLDGAMATVVAVPTEYLLPIPDGSGHARRRPGGAHGDDARGHQAHRPRSRGRRCSSSAPPRSAWPVP